MGLILLQQTDTAATCGIIAGCSGAAAPNLGKGRQATVGGTPGVTLESVRINGSGSGDQYAVAFETAPGEPGLINWKAGDWVIRLNIGLANSDITWVETHVCRFNAACTSQETVGSLTGQSISLGSTGVKTMTVAGAAVAALNTDRPYIVLVFANATALLKIFRFTPDQVIDTPLVASIATLRRRRGGY